MEFLCSVKKAFGFPSPFGEDLPDTYEFRVSIAFCDEANDVASVPEHVPGLRVLISVEFAFASKLPKVKVCGLVAKDLHSVIVAKSLELR
jgi:hypothetical protein